MKVYVVTHGQYSDYGISHVFATRELAQAFLDKYHAIVERTHTHDGESQFGEAYVSYGSYNPDVDEWEVLDEVPPLYESWKAKWTEDTGLSRHAPATGEGKEFIYCAEISPTADAEDELTGADFYHFRLPSPPDIKHPYNGPKDRPPREVRGIGRTPEEARKAMHDKLAFLKAVAEGIA